MKTKIVKKITISIFIASKLQSSSNIIYKLIKFDFLTKRNSTQTLPGRLLKRICQQFAVNFANDVLTKRI